MGKKSYKTTCPSCGGDNFYVTEWNGVGYCFSSSCNYWERDGTKANTPRKKERSPNLNEIRAFYRQVAAYYHSSLDGNALQYLHNRGFTDDTIQRLQIGYCPVGKYPIYKGNIAKEAGLATKQDEAFLGGRITFPYLNADGTVTDIRGRAIDPLDELKYKSPFGDVYSRGADYPYNHQLCTAPRLIITEGEIKADIAVQEGFDTIALPGMGNWREGFKQRSGQVIIILFDSQRNMRDVAAAIRKIANKLYQPLVATLPLMGKNKQDIDSFIINHGVEAFRAVINAPLPFDDWNRLQRF